MPAASRNYLEPAVGVCARDRFSDRLHLVARNDRRRSRWLSRDAKLRYDDSGKGWRGLLDTEACVNCLNDKDRDNESKAEKEKERRLLLFIYIYISSNFESLNICRSDL